MIQVRPTGILIEDGKLLVLDQDVDEHRSWSLPGGKLEEGETLETGLAREFLEEVNLRIAVKELLFVCDFIRGDKHVLHMTFRVKREAGDIKIQNQDLDLNKIRGAEFIPIDKLTDYGFSTKFQRLVQTDFKNTEAHMGDKSNIGL